jgi:hypothetical protein
MITFSIRKLEETGEHHIYEGKLTSSDPLECVSGKNSICKKVMRSDTKHIGKSCLAEDVARKAAAVLGRSVCGVCVSHLYATPE